MKRRHRRLPGTKGPNMIVDVAVTELLQHCRLTLFPFHKTITTLMHKNNLFLLFSILASLSKIYGLNDKFMIGQFSDSPVKLYLAMNNLLITANYVLEGHINCWLNFRHR